MDDRQDGLFRQLEDGTLRFSCPGCGRALLYLEPNDHQDQPVEMRLRCDVVRGSSCRQVVNVHAVFGPGDRMQIDCEAEPPTDVEHFDPTPTREERRAAILAGGFDTLDLGTDVEMLRVALAGALAERDEALALAQTVARSNRTLAEKAERDRQSVQRSEADLAARTRQVETLRQTVDRLTAVTGPDVADMLTKVDAAIDSTHAARERMERHQIEYLASLSNLYAPIRDVMSRLGYTSKNRPAAFGMVDIGYPDSDDIGAAESKVGQGHERCCAAHQNVYHLTINTSAPIEAIVRDAEMLRTIAEGRQNTVETDAPETR